MPWLKTSDTAAMHPMRLALASAKDPQQRHEAWGFAMDCAVLSAAYTTDYFVRESTAAALSPRAAFLCKLLVKVGIFGPKITGPNGEKGWLLVKDEKLWHIMTEAELTANRERRNHNRNVAENVEIRLRDGDQCRYCDIVVHWSDRVSARAGTYDRVIPGLPDRVVACKHCNSSKKDMTPEEAGMVLLDPPARPVYGPETVAYARKHGVVIDLAPGADLDLTQTRASSASDASQIRAARPGSPGRVGQLEQVGPAQVGPLPGRVQAVPGAGEGAA